MSASPLLQPDIDPSKGGSTALAKTPEASASPERNLNPVSVEFPLGSSEEEYVQLQQRLFLATLIVSAFAASFTAIFFDFSAAISLLIGAFAGVLYLRLLARSIGKLGRSSKGVSKIQLVVPVVLVLAALKLSELHFLPALLGFLLYKPSLMLQVLLESRIQAKSVSS